MNWRVIAVGAVIIVPFVAVLASGFGKDPRAVPSVLEGHPAPDFALETAEGGQVISLKDLRGHPVVLNFYASWCVPCAQEHPWLVKISKIYQPRGVTFLGVIYNDTVPKVKGFLRRYGQNYPTLQDPSSATAIDYGVAGVPETYIINGQGQIVRKFVGPVTPEEFESTLEALL